MPHSDHILKYLYKTLITTFFLVNVHLKKNCLVFLAIKNILYLENIISKLRLLDYLPDDTW